MTQEKKGMVIFMAEIKVLPQDIADKIAAGEVAERPSAVVKELVENSIDAGADRIEVEIKNGGIRYIRVTDNGCGIKESQIETAFMRHATSKLSSIDDLYKIGTMGFRGEALSSICAVADVEIITKTADCEEGIYAKFSRGKCSQKDKLACGEGTTMVVENLFENIPARMKFLKRDMTEAGYVNDVLSRIALANPGIAFSYICDDKEIFSTTGDGSLKNVILKIYGLDHAKGVIEVIYKEDGAEISGVIGKPELARGNRTRQTLIVNSRYIKNNVISKVVSEAYRNSIMGGKFPFFVLNITVPLDCVDVNVHPAKTEVKFSDESRIYEIVYHAVNNALYGKIKKDENKVTEQNVNREEPVYVQEEMTHKKTDSFYEPRRETVNPKEVKAFMESFSPEDEEKRENLNRESEAIYSTVDFLSENRDVYQVRETDLEPVITEKSEPIEEAVIKKTPSPIGQIFDTYVLCQSGDTFYLIDQHAAHERARFEELKASYYSKEKMSQILLVPIIVRLDLSEYQTVLQNSEIFSGFGFDIEDFGSGSVIVNASPLVGGEGELRDLILEICDAVETRGGMSVAEFEERALDTIACKYAVKANKKLNPAEMQDIINKVWELEKKSIKTCPHGRPVKIEFSKTEIEKMFKRKL